MNITMTVLYGATWAIVFCTAFLVIGSLLQYIGLKQKSMKALIGLIMIGILWLAAAIGVALAQARSINLVQKGGHLVLFLDIFVMQNINQWTIANVQKRIQRIIRWSITSLTIVMGLVVVSFFLFVHL